MNAKELMIGDWVQFANGNKIKCRINCISPHQRFVAHVDNATWLVNFDEIEPIPLTEEILKANGFEIFFVSKVCAARIYQTLELYDWEHCNKWYTNIGRTNVSLSYVHELQRVLRCCGLFNLADNIKI